MEKKNNILSKEDINDYNEGIVSISTLSDKYQVSYYIVRRWLEENNCIIKTGVKAKKNLLTESDIEEYKKGHFSRTHIANKYNVGYCTVSKWLSEKKVVPYKKRRIFSQEEESLLQDCVIGKIRLKDVAKKLDISSERVRQILQNRGIKKVHVLDFRNETIIEKVKELLPSIEKCEYTIQGLSDVLGVNTKTTREVIKEMGISNSKFRKVYPKIKKSGLVLSEEDKIAFLSNEITINELSKKYKVSTSTIRNALDRQKIRQYDRIDFRKVNLTEEEIDDLTNRRITISQLAVKYGVTHVTINKAMYRQNVEIKS